MKNSDLETANILVVEALMRSKEEEIEDIQVDIRELKDLLSSKEENAKEIDDTINSIIASILLIALPGSSLLETVNDKLNKGVTINQIKEVLDPQPKKSNLKLIDSEKS